MSHRLILPIALAAEQPAIQKESMAIGQKWGEELATRVLAVLEMGRGKGPGPHEIPEERPPATRTEANERAATGTLRTMATSQAHFQSAAIIDQDGDGQQWLPAGN